MDEGAQAPEVQTIRGHPFVVGPRYHCIEFIGEGAYGIVIKASDNQADPANGENFGNSIITLINESLILGVVFDPCVNFSFFPDFAT